MAYLQGASHRLEIATPQDAEAVQANLHLSDLSTDDEDRVGSQMRTYEKKIDSLMTEVGTLKNEVLLIVNVLINFIRNSIPNIPPTSI